MNWKDLMKTATLLFVALFAFAACSDDDKEEPQPKAEDAALLTFGFYQEDNAGVLSKDYVAQVPAVSATATTYNIEIAMPSIVDKSALVARFTVTEGNTIVAGGVAQVSRQTANDFTAPVDYTVSNSDQSQNLRYTVTVTKANNMVWREVTNFTAAMATGDNNATGVYAGAVMKINPKDNLPYFVFGVRGIDNKLTVVKFDGMIMKSVGAASFTNKVSGSHYSLDIAPDGTPYVVYNDQEATNKGGISVMKYDGSAWSNVGDPGITATTAQYACIAALENGLVAVQQNNKAGDFVKRAIVASYWNGSAWTTEAAAEGLYGYAGIGSNGKEAYILGVGASAPNAYTIVKASDKSVLVQDYLPEGATSGYIYGNSVVVAPDGTMYLLAVDNATGIAKMRLSVYKNGAFQTVGGDALSLSKEAYDRHMVVRAAIAPDGTPYIAYNDYNGDKSIYFVYLDSETKQWTDPIKAFDTLGKSVDDVNIAFTTNGIGYLAFTDESNQIHLLQYSEK